jgi:hypothetical protein
MSARDAGTGSFIGLHPHRSATGRGGTGRSGQRDRAWGWLSWFAAGIVRISPCLIPISPLLRQIRQFSMTQSMRLRRRRKELGVGYALPLVPPGRDTKTAPRGLEDVGAESRFRNINPVPVIEPVKSCRRSRCGVDVVGSSSTSGRNLVFKSCPPVDLVRIRICGTCPPMWLTPAPPSRASDPEDWL